MFYLTIRLKHHNAMDKNNNGDNPVLNNKCEGYSIIKQNMAIKVYQQDIFKFWLNINKSRRSNEKINNHTSKDRDL